MNIITFDKLKAKIIKDIQNPLWLAMKCPGEYCLDIMLQMLGKEPKPNTISKCAVNTAIVDEVHNIIANYDIRCLDSLLAFCKEYSVNIPKWLYKGYGIELGEEGWIVFSTANDYEI